MKKNFKVSFAVIFIFLNAGVLNLTVSAQVLMGTSPVTEPYPYVSTGSFSGPVVAQSPDPLVSYRWTNPQASDGLEIYLQKPVNVTTDLKASFDNLPSMTGSSPNVTVKGLGSIQVDFGKENAAWLEFDSPDLTGNVEMSISEYNEPARVNSGPAHPAKTATPVKYGNTYRLELNSSLYEGVRFGWIHVRSFTSPWHITGIRIVCQTKPANYNGSFSCSDSMLTRIWYTGAYTVKTNLLKDYFSAILMDRGDRYSWTGDAYPAQAASLVAFGNYDFIKKNIENTSNQSNGIRSYSLYWVQSLLDYYNYTGDTVTLRTYINNAGAKLNDAYTVFGSNPNLDFYGWDERLGSGFENASCTESQNAYKMLTIRVWKEFAASMGKVGRHDLQDKYNGYATEKINMIRKDALWYKNYGLHAGADAITTNILTAAEQNGLYDNDFNDRINRISFSPFNQYFIIQAYARMNKFDEALGTVRDLWGGQIQYGGTTFFENFRPSWNSILKNNDAVPNNQAGYASLCHPWGAGVTKWLSEEVLGIKPTSPGFTTYDILPHLGRTLTNVSGKTPTPLGDISVGFDVSTGICNVTAPVGSIGRIGIPKVEKNITSIKVNGVTAWDGMYHPVAGLGDANEDSLFVYFTDVQPGVYSFNVTYNGSTPTYADPHEQYPATFIKEDSTTSGNWGHVYGKDGYVLCNYYGNKSDKKSLPIYVTSIDYAMFGGNGLPNDCLWSSGINNPQVLASDASNSNLRNAACYYTADPEACRNTMTFRININGTKDYQVALYFLDWDNRGRRLAVEMFDANTLNLIAPVKIVTGFFGGKYLIFSYNKSAKFRIDQVRGDNAALSGIFFDSPSLTSTGVNNIHKDEENSENPFERIYFTTQLAEFSFTTQNANDNIKATLFDSQGRNVATPLNGNFTGYNRISHSLPVLSPGVYLLQARVNNKNVLNKKFLIEK